MRARAQHLLQRFAQIRENRAILSLALLLGAFLVLSLVVHSPGLLRIDQRITRTIQQGGSGTLNWIAAGLTSLGGVGTLVVLELCAAAGFYWTKRPWAARLCLATLLWLPVNLLTKELVGRPRPEDSMVNVVLPAVGLSFPSGHAMGSTTVYGFLALMAWIHIPRRKLRLFWTTAFVAVAVCISLSRIYLGVHWFSDVVGGWTAGLFFVLILAEIYKAFGAAELAPH